MQATLIGDTPFMFMRGGEHDYLMRSEKRPGGHTGGAMPPRQRKRKPKKHPIYAVITILLLLIAYPIGLILLWVKKLRWSTGTKLLVSLVTGILFFVLMAFALTFETSDPTVSRIQNQVKDKLTYVMDAGRAAVSDKEKIEYNLIENGPKLVTEGTALAVDFALKEMPVVRSNVQRLNGSALSLGKSLVDCIDRNGKVLLSRYNLIDLPQATITPEITKQPEATSQPTMTPKPTAAEKTPAALNTATPGMPTPAATPAALKTPAASPTPTRTPVQTADVQPTPASFPQETAASALNTQTGKEVEPTIAVQTPVPDVTPKQKEISKSLSEPTPKSASGAEIKSTPGTTPKYTPAVNLNNAAGSKPAQNTPSPTQAVVTPSPSPTPAPTPSPTPIVLPEAKSFDDVKVYYYDTSTFYHKTPDCSNMHNAHEHTLVEAAETGKPPCSKCAPPSTELLNAKVAVWCGTDGVFHIDGSCENLTEEWSAMTFEEAWLEKGMSGCPLCGADLYEEAGMIAQTTPVPAPDEL